MAQSAAQATEVTNKWLSTGEAVNTVFLPRRLPDHATEDHCGTDFGESGAMAAFADFNRSLLPDHITNMIYQWNDHYHLDVIGLRECLQELQLGETMAAHLVMQNAALSFTSVRRGERGDHDDNATDIVVRAYNVQPCMEAVTSATGPLSVTAPAMSVLTTTDVVFSDAFLEQVVSLQTNTFSDAIAKAKRHGETLDEPRDAVSPKYVMEWLMSILSALGSDDSATNAIEKKVRDAVMFSKQKHKDKFPWRRHPAWLAFKSVLHATLVSDCGLDDGTLLYKSAMLQFMTAFLDVHTHQRDPDLIHQMLAKVSGRIQKLNTTLSKRQSGCTACYATQVEVVLKNSADAVVRISKQQNALWESTTKAMKDKDCQQQQQHSQIPVITAADTHLPLSASIRKLSSMRVKSFRHGKTRTPATKSQHANKDSVRNLVNDSHSFSEAEQLSGVHEFEQSILELWRNRDSHTTSMTQLRSWMKEYGQAMAKVDKCKDPIGHSRRLVIGALLAALCDMQATAIYPLLLQHQTDVSVASLDEILAFNKEMLSALNEVQAYFNKRDDDDAQYDTGPLQQKVSARSITVRLGGKDAAMLETRDRMQAEDETRKQAHASRVQAALASMAREEADLARMEHERGTVYSRRARCYRENVHLWACRRCAKEKIMNAETETVFEAKLPTDASEALAVVFEAQLPGSFGIWRDTIYYYNSLIVNSVSSSSSSSGYSWNPSSSKGTLWRDDIRLQYGSTSLVALGSTTRRLSQNHYNTTTLRHHSLGDFVKSCQLNCRLLAEEKSLGDIKRNRTTEHRRECSWKLNDSVLDTYLPACSHQQSEVIASQSQCPQSFSLQEFIAFGSLRAGDRLQWFNILRGIHQHTLLLHQPQVVQLICQAIWQAGDNSADSHNSNDGNNSDDGTTEADNNPLRNAHQPCHNEEFVSALTSELSNVLQSLQQNWQHHWALCAVIVLANRLYDIYSQCNDHDSSLSLKLKTVLQFARNIASKWLKKINILMQKDAQANTADLQQAAACIATFGMLSFSHCAVLIEPRKRQGRTLQLWMRFVTEVKNNTQGAEASALPSFLENLRNMAIRVTIDRHDDLVRLLNNGFEQLEDGGCTHHELESYMNEFYSPGTCVDCTVHFDNQLWITVDWKTASGVQAVEVDLRQGQFCINGQPQSRLSDDVTADPLYQQHFSGVVFMVKPFDSPRNETAHITECWNSSSRFVFASAKNTALGKTLNIYELRQGMELQLIPKDWFTSAFDNDVPVTMLEGRSLWMDIATGIIYFRAQSINEPEFYDLDKCDFTLNTNTRILQASSRAPVGVGQNSVLLPHSSAVGTLALETLSVLELPCFIEVWRNEDESVQVRLPRFGLSFGACVGDMTFESNDHKGWYIDNNQYFGTLLGLSSALVLVKDKGHESLKQTCVLVPHGKIKLKKTSVALPANLTIRHHGVAIDKTELSTPPFFRYDVNNTVKQLTGPFNQTSWIYLAALHAFTSSVFVDPFTGVTGVEMAMHILQSARCWAGVPFEASTLTVLDTIREKLCPKRSFYPSSSKPLMQIVAWPKHIASMCASDAYAFLVAKLRDHNGQLYFLHGADVSENTVEVQDEADDCYAELCPGTGKRRKTCSPKNRLASMEYLRSSSWYPIMARVQRQHAPVATPQSPAFADLPDLSRKVEDVTLSIVKQNARLDQYSAEIIQYALLEASTRSEGDAFMSVVATEQLRSCAEWPLLDLTGTFLSLHKHINAFKNERLHLAFLLSFMAFQLGGSGSRNNNNNNNNNSNDSYNRKGHRRAHDDRTTSNASAQQVLIDVLVALTSTEATVPPPACTYFPAPPVHLKTESSSALMGKFCESLTKFLSCKGVDGDGPSCDLTEKYSSWVKEKTKFTEVYGRDKRLLDQAVEKDLTSGIAILDTAVYEYDRVEPQAPELPFENKICSDDLFRQAGYRRYVQLLLNRSNRSRILQCYTKEVSEATASLPQLRATVCPAAKLLPARRLSDQLGKPADMQYGFAPASRNFASGVTQMWTEAAGKSAATGRTRRSTTRQLPLRLKPLLQPLQQNTETDPIIKDFADDLSKSCSALGSQEASSQSAVDPISATEQCTRNYRQSRAHADKAWTCLSQSMAMTCAKQHGTRAMHACGLLMRCRPLSVFPAILKRDDNALSCCEAAVNECFPDKFRDFIGGLIVCLVTVQYHMRKLRYLLENQLDWFDKEARSSPHSTWTPKEHPEWLLFELENDLCVWPRQVEVAQQMMHPPDDEHAVMQLNMGEGKTSVIMPIIAAELADGEALVRLIVLTSLLNTNCNQLIFKLGGMLNRRILTLPFRRDIRLDSKQVSTILDVVRKCRRDKGVIVTVREHLLSKQLKFFESCCKQDLGMSAELARLEEFFNRYARDVIDEADEVLHHRFQLVYPIGNRQDPDGDEDRWFISQIVLECVKDLAGTFSERFQSTVNFTFADKQTFPLLRILESARRDEAYAWLCDNVAENVLAGRGRRSVSVDSEVMDTIHELPDTVREWLKRFVLSKEMAEAQVIRFNTTIPTPIHKAMLCLKGLLAHEILLLALQKRYRVEYGLLATTSGYKAASGRRAIQMAVPFRAKDVAAERTEFGHTDVAIILTSMSYYRHGLTGDQIDMVFDKLEQKDKPSQNSIYDLWVMMAENVDASVTKLDGVNRKDKAMMKELVYSFLENHTAAINFFLNNFIFPHEAKEFPQKLVGNAWSMTPSSRSKLVTGFSGTNDTRHLLPGSVHQQDLPALQHTNAHVCNLLLRKTNDVYSSELPTQCSGVQLLEMLPGSSTASTSHNTVNTLIDVGAVILDLTNKQVAKHWLQLRKNKQAVVYFDVRNQLRVLDRQSHLPCKLELSPYADDLTDCLVYLDHSHTRGTDLRMVTGTRAAVTLGKGLRRDELVQACMRMRRLGAGHTLSFWAPPEIDRLVRERCQLSATAKIHHFHVLLWCFFNSIDATKDGFLSWANQGLAFFQHTDRAMTMATQDGRSLESSQAIQVIGSNCLIPDCMELNDMYGKPREKQRIADIIGARGGDAAGVGQLVDTCKRFVPNVVRYAHKLDEEQERELEQEVEEEKEQEKPPRTGHIKETCPDYLTRLARFGDMTILSEELCDAMPIWDCLKSTSLVTDHETLITSSAWKWSQLLATKSFAETVPSSILVEEAMPSADHEPTSQSPSPIHSSGPQASANETVTSSLAPLPDVHCSSSYSSASTVGNAMAFGHTAESPAFSLPLPSASTVGNAMAFGHTAESPAFSLPLPSAEVTSYQSLDVDCDVVEYHHRSNNDSPVVESHNRRDSDMHLYGTGAGLEWDREFLLDRERQAQRAKVDVQRRLRMSFVDKFLRPVEWVLVVRKDGYMYNTDTVPPMVVLALSPFEANALLGQQPLHPSVSLHLYASPLHPQQGLMADWALTAAGPSLGRLCDQSSDVQCVFAELLCFAGGLFFGRTNDDMMATMAHLCELLELEPRPQESDETHRMDAGPRPVGWRKPCGGNDDDRRFPRNPLLLVRGLLKLLRSNDSVDVSDMGSLVLQHSWPDLRYDDSDEMEC